MSAQVKVIGIDAVKPDVWTEKPGTRIGEDVITGHALVIDTASFILVVEGTPDELREFAGQVTGAAATLP